MVQAAIQYERFGMTDYAFNAFGMIEKLYTSSRWNSIKQFLYS
jgi:hypothetical protein